MSEVKLNICHMYPEVLNLYGDRGNILCLKKRLEWRGIDVNLSEVRIGDNDDLTKYDLFFIGGGQDFEQEVLLNDIRSGKGDNIKAAVEDGKTFLCICGGYQMMGHYYETKDGEKLEFLGAVDFHTVGGDVRMIGNYAFKCTKESGGSDIVAFENHSGRTYLEPGVLPLGTVLRGYGNNGEDKKEGVHKELDVQVSQFKKEGIELKAIVWTPDTDTNFAACSRIRKEIWAQFNMVGIQITA